MTYIVPNSLIDVFGWFKRSLKKDSTLPNVSMFKVHVSSTNNTQNT